MTDPFANSAYKELPPEVIALLRRVSAPPRLIAHLILVHDVASRLVVRLSETFPGVTFDKEVVLFGASTHDIGKAIDSTELIQPGHDHEKRGFELLRKMGVAEERARFAYTHGNWKNAENIHLEDLLVSMADKVWRGRRVDELEMQTAQLLSASSGAPVWNCYSQLDEILQLLASEADVRLAWQGQFNPKCEASQSNRA